MWVLIVVGIIPYELLKFHVRASQTVCHEFQDRDVIVVSVNGKRLPVDRV